MIVSTEQEPIELLKYPHPYQAAFTVTSDIDSASIARFRGIHALFCGHELVKQHSPEWQALGLTPSCPGFDGRRGGVPGLGLDFGDSFFLIGDPTTFGMYRHAPEEDRFREDDQSGENCAVLVRRWIKEGQIDSFHTFLHYRRSQVEPLLNEFYQWCERENIPKPRVWINHSTPVAPTGICPQRLQANRLDHLARLTARKIVGPLLGLQPTPLRYAFCRYHGDTPGSEHYVNDLLARNGLRYVWLNAGSYRANQIALRETLQNGRATFLKPLTMDDGIRYYEFERCYGMPAGPLKGNAYLRDCDEGFDSSALISDKTLQELCRCNGTCILYTHWTHYRSMPLTPQTVARFELLKRWRDAGKIWITSTARLLEWSRRRVFLAVRCHREGKHLIVEIEGVDDPFFGHERLDAHELQGLCLRVQPAEQDVRLALNGEAVNSDQLRHEGNLYWLDFGGSAQETTPVKEAA